MVRELSWRPLDAYISISVFQMRSEKGSMIASSGQPFKTPSGMFCGAQC